MRGRSILPSLLFASSRRLSRSHRVRHGRRRSGATRARPLGPTAGSTSASDRSWLLPTDGGPLGGGIDAGLRYGFAAGPTIVAPGIRAAGYLVSQRFVALGMPTLRVTLPGGPFAPFVTGGVGPRWISNPEQTGLAVLAGGGLMIHFGRVFAIGAEATYQTVTGTDMRSVAIGPSILLGS